MKVNTETYKVVNDHWEWGFFTVLPRGMYAFTDFGCYGFTFDPGESTAKEFLARLTESDYLLRKVSPRSILDVDATERAIRYDIVRQRREGYIDKKRARELWDDIPADDTEIMRWVMEQPEFYENDGYKLAVYDFPTAAKGFAQRLFPLFRDELRKELSAASGAGALHAQATTQESTATTGG